MRSSSATCFSCGQSPSHCSKKWRSRHTEPPTLGEAIVAAGSAAKLLADIAANQDWVSVGITHDTAAFAVAAIRQWLQRMGRQRYPDSRELTITADCGGSNGARVRLWRVKLQEPADERGLTIHVCHYPQGKSKWNRIEHRLLWQNWRARPLVSRMTVVELIAVTTTKTGALFEFFPKGRGGS